MENADVTNKINIGTAFVLQKLGGDLIMASAQGMSCKSYTCAVACKSAIRFGYMAKKTLASHNLLNEGQIKVM